LGAPPSTTQAQIQRAGRADLLQAISGLKQQQQRQQQQQQHLTNNHSNKNN
jgi:hypothetical protein